MFAHASETDRPSSREHGALFWCPFAQILTVIGWLSCERIVSASPCTMFCERTYDAAP